MRPTARFHRVSLAILLSAALAAGCGGSPASPTPPVDQFPDAPRITCPSAVSVTSSNNQPTVVVYGSATSSGAPPVSVSCTPASLTVFPIGLTTVTCTATDARQRTASCTFGVTVVAPPTISLARFVAFGDSMTLGEDGNASASVRPTVVFPAAKTYPGVLQKALASRYTAQAPKVDNRGVAGERLSDAGTRSRFSSVVGGGSYDAVLIMEGANDVADRDDRTIAAAIDGLRQMLRDARSRGVRPYLATIPPEVPGGRRALAWSYVPLFNDQVRALATSEDVTVVEVYQALITDTNRFIGADGLHLTEDGYARVADAFFQALKGTLERLPTLTFSPTNSGFLRR